MVRKKKDQTVLILLLGLAIFFFIFKSSNKTASPEDAMSVLLYDLNGKIKGIPILSSIEGTSNVGYISLKVAVINNGDLLLKNVTVKSLSSGLIFRNQTHNITGFSGRADYYSDLYCVDETCGFYDTGDKTFEVNVTGFYEFPIGIFNKIYKENSIMLHIEQDQISYGGSTGGSTLGTNGTCLTGGTPCGSGQECCSGSCLNSTGVYECKDCGLVLRSCSSSSDCCSGLLCEGSKCHYDVDLPCLRDNECRSGALCHDYRCLFISGEVCTEGVDCITGYCVSQLVNETCGAGCGVINVCGTPP